ncbi:MAG: hypothetical protein HYY78_05060 [Betaproteobacteria bacterium]|nr:hypothetical protein [Betaproteobacteria bacterium]
MEKPWQTIVKDPDERKVLEALANPAWDFRTLDGITRDTMLPEARVQQIINKYLSQAIVRPSPIPDKQGRQLFTLTSREAPLGEYLSVIRSFITKTSS